MTLGFYKDLARKAYMEEPTINVQTVQAILREIEGILYISFRGTDAKLDWVNNFLFFKKVIPYDNASSKIRVHGGWLEQYKQNGVRDVIQQTVKSFNGSKVVVIGHSYGASLATLCSVDLQYNFTDKQIYCVSLSSPRVGNKEFVTSYNKRVSHFGGYIGNDIVHSIPPLWLGFRHINNNYHFGHRVFFNFLKNTLSILFLWLTKHHINNIEDLDMVGDHDIWRDGIGPSGKVFNDKPMLDNIEVGF